MVLPVRPIVLRGGAREMFFSRSPRVLYEGPAGTGKSFAVGCRIDHDSRKYPGLRTLIVRATRESMTESVLKTWEEDVLGYGHPALMSSQMHRSQRPHYTYPYAENTIAGYTYRGQSVVAAKGLDKVSRTLSAEWDRIWLCEGVECTLDTIETLYRCFRSNRTVLQQFIVETNPGDELHPLNQLANEGKFTRVYGRHEDNPSLTEEYLEGLRMLTGARRKRLYEGLWVSETGQVLDQYDPAVHIIQPHEVPHLVWFYGSMDFGYRNPGVLQVWGVDKDDNDYRVALVYRTQRTIDWWAERCLDLYREFPMRVIAADPSEPGLIAEINDRMGRALGRTGPSIVCPADNDVRAGIDQVQERLKVRIRHDGKPEARMYFVDGALRFGRDEELVEDRKPWTDTQEFGSVIWEKAEDGRPLKDKPRKLNDHGFDATRYGAMWRFLQRPPAVDPVRDYPRGTVGAEFFRAEEFRPHRRPA